MTNNEINKTIAEYMGEVSIVGAKWITDFTTSLDSLVPVWEKLDVHWVMPKFRGHTFKSSFNICTARLGEVSHCSDTRDLYYSASLATAKAILEIKK